MKITISISIITLIIVCSCGDKKPQETVHLTTTTFTFQAPTQDMLNSGKTTFDTYCYICHENAIGEMTMLTDKALWIENKVKNLETLIQHIHNGYTGNYGTMPPQGTCMECSKDDLRDAIIYMMKETGI